MKARSYVLMAVCLLLSLSALAAAEDKMEVFGGYQYTRFGGDGAFNANGFNGAVTGTLKGHLGITGDFSGAFATVAGVSSKTQTYTFGPEFSGRQDAPFTPFAHALFGGFHASASAGGVSAGSDGFAMLFGGGVDARMSDKLAIRVGQFDWMALRSNGNTANKNFRYSAGVVLHF